MSDRETIVDGVARAISRAILDGTHPVGSRLPSVRALAQAHDVNVSTIQRVLTRLEERRLVRTHDRSGVEVCDPQRSGGTSLWPLVLERASQDPAPAVALLRDALATRRLLASEVLRAVAKQPYESYRVRLEAALATLTEEASRPQVDRRRLLDADAEILRTLLVVAQRPAILGIFNDVQSMIASTPALVESFFGEPALVLHAWRSLALMLARGGVEPTVLDALQTTLAMIDERIVSAFVKRIGA